MEKEIKIKTKDKKIIYGTLMSAKKRSKKLVILCHGFTGNSNEHIFFNGAAFFADKGYDAFRFDFYSHRKGNRHFEETSLKQHGADITTVVKHFRSLYDSIYLIGHSFGGPSVVLSDTSLVEAAVLWDPSYIVPAEEKKDLLYDKRFGEYAINWGMRIIIGKRFIEDLFAMTDYGALVGTITTPTKIIAAGEKNLKNSKKYLKHLKVPKAFVKIPKADHCFNTHAAEKRLFEETYMWIKRW